MIDIAHVAKIALQRALTFYLAIFMSDNVQQRRMGHRPSPLPHLCPTVASYNCCSLRGDRVTEVLGLFRRRSVTVFGLQSIRWRLIIPIAGYDVCQHVGYTCVAFGMLSLNPHDVRGCMLAFDSSMYAVDQIVGVFYELR